MTRGTVQVEQINNQGDMFLDYDTRLSSNELYMILEKNFPNARKSTENTNYIECSWEGNDFLIRVKNITYLGKPHKLYKKRYQIPTDLDVFYAMAVRKEYIPLMIGVYTCGDMNLFVSFSIESYIGNEHNNSSAHVSSYDLQQVLMVDEEDQEQLYGFFEKTDINGNRIFVFDKDSVKYFLSNIVKKEEEREIRDELNAIREKMNAEFVKKIGREKTTEIEKQYDETHLKINGAKLLPNKTRDIILNYFATVEKKWYGKACYNTMWGENYRNKNQAEWPGFYLEYSFEKYLKDNNYLSTISYAQDKVSGGIDLDLFLTELDTYADLKAHTVEKRGIPGNKVETVREVLESKNQVIYIVCEHETEKDAKYGYRLTKYWNENKTNRKPNQKNDSYKNRMKYLVELKKIKILAIDATNVEYLKGFKQGKNSNGKKRNVKLMIDGRDINKFLRISYEL